MPSTATPSPDQVVPDPADAAAAQAAADRASDDPSARPAPRFVFVDCEATGLDIPRHQLTEVSWILRREDGTEVERQYFPEHTLDGADEQALEITRYHDRIAPQEKVPASVWLAQFLEDASGAYLVGAVPDFDARAIAGACAQNRLEPTWDHHLIDVETLALPLISDIPDGPRSLAKTCKALGLAFDKDQAHGALYDARMAMAAFDAIWETLTRIRAEGATLPPAVPRPVRTDRGATDETAD